MNNKFFSDKRIIDFSGIKFSVQESNSKVSDKAFTKYTFPFEFYIDSNFIEGFGDLEDYALSNFNSIIAGFMQYNGKIHEAKLNITTVLGKKVTAQIDFGFEQLPNWDKKLSELPLEKFAVPDIYDFAKATCSKVYPQTNFNFPRIYTAKYSPDQAAWDAFDGYYNDMEKDGSGMRRNYIDAKGNIFNINIIHPMPHLLYLLKTGFADAGYMLGGEILNDPFFINSWVFSGTQYFSDKQQRRHRWKFSTTEAETLHLVNGPEDYSEYHKYMSLTKAGKYKIAGMLAFFKAQKMTAIYKILLNGNVIWSRSQGGDKQTVLDKMQLNIDFDVTEENSTLELFILTQYHENWEDEMADLLVTSSVLDDTVADSEEATDVITNLNEIDLSKAVPQITFGDLMNVMRNWFNYDWDILDNRILMNKIGDKEPQNIKDGRTLQVNEPERNRLSQRSFLLRFPEMDNGFVLNSAYYDSNGLALNKPALTDTKIIDINGYALPIEVPKTNGYKTATVKKDTDSMLALVFYNGLQNGQNNAIASPAVNFPDLFFSNWEKWLSPRLSGWQYKWKAELAAADFSFDIKDVIFAYENLHVITDWTLDYNHDVVSAEITTETLYQ